MDNTTVTNRTAERDDLVRSMYLDGRYSDREIGEALGLHRVTVTLIRKRLGVKKSDRRPAA